PLNAGIDTADASGNFELSLISGDYAIAAVKDSFLISLTKFLDVDGIVSNMTFLLSQPEAMHNPDSIYVALQQNQTRDTLLEVANIATGDLFVEAVEGNFVNTTSLPVGNSFRHQQLPITDLLKKRVAPSYATDNPPDSLWKQIHHDRQENSQNIYDLKDTFYQRDGNRFYLKLTTHVIPAPFTDFRINVFLDTDNNGLTGPNIFGLGTDYLIAVGNLGGGFNGYLLRWNAVSQQFEFVDFVDDFNMYPPSKSVTIGVDEVNIGNPDFVKVYISAFNSNNLAATMDYVPSSNLGYLSAALTDVSWLHLSPLFDLANADSSAALAITIDPQNITGGSYLSGLTIYSSHAGEMRQDFLPIRLDYTTGIAGNQPALPQRFEVGQNYPNPFNPNTEVQFGLPSDSRVKIEIFNILGQRIFLRETPQLSAGYHTFQWNGTDSQGNRVSSGVYFYKISNDDKAKVRKMILMR
nr:T9SS type A sorting domain-containing protein [candidate division Zixibacteria bacterium]NIT61484.1 T9SS type A sorting domain-containing protein [Fodinibius sp.]NIU16947.1 T9SS type A sorting domain-containing protein [candidate division Zixibacteria bacterium]NIV09100.1 T9SS type A sorting domain-containing protein [candidate division Zixibacteria bacterium]NIY30064.1 T9SS type A sorting domain-containing protein [Fodinibius sp.]